MLLELPLELQLAIVSKMDCQTISALAATSKYFHDLSKDESLWIDLTKSQFGVQLKTTDGFSPRLFYKQVIHPFKNAFGVWNRHNLKFYGGLARVSLQSDCVVVQELIPPHKLDGQFGVQDFVKICYNSEGGEDGGAVIENKSKIARSSTVKIEIDENNCGLTIILPDAEDHTENPDEWREVMAEFCTTIMGEGASMTDLLLFRFIETLHSRSYHRYERIARPRTIARSKNCPLTDGIFLGTYGPHGIEVIQLRTPTSGEMLGTAGIKVTGDPNVSFGEITFQVNENQCLDLTKEEQDSMAAIEQFSSNPRYIDYRPDLQLMFFSPVDCFPRDTVKFDKCSGRWSCECQVAQHGGYNPRLIPGHLIMFDQDNLGVLFIELRSLCLFKRVTDQLFN